MVLDASLKHSLYRRCHPEEGAGPFASPKKRYARVARSIEPKKEKLKGAEAGLCPIARAAREHINLHDLAVDSRVSQEAWIQTESRMN